MSIWTHIQSIIIAKTTNSDTPLKDIKSIMKHAPKITGSEEDAFIFINHIPRTTSSCIDENGECHKYENDFCITIVGDLRDRCFEETAKEYSRFIRFINKYFYCVNHNFYIIDDFGKEVFRRDQTW